MMKFIPIFFLLILSSCSETGVDARSKELGEILFETEHINLAWGIYYEGSVIQKNGNIYSYNPAKDSVPVPHHSGTSITGEELTAKYAHRKTLIGTTDPDTLQWAYRLAAEVAPDAVSDTSQTGADMGSVIYSIYLYTPNTGTYRRIVLRQEGDITFYNTSEPAVLLAAWMKKR